MKRFFAAIGLALAGAAPAQAAVCDEVPPPTRAERFERRVHQGQAFRRDAGIPAGRKRVIGVLRSPRKSLRWGVPLSPFEADYIDRVSSTSSSAGWERVERYARRRPSAFGGISVGRDYPRGGAAVVRFTRRIAHHRAALRPLADFPVRVKRVDYPERRLRRLQDRIDHDALADEGTDIQGIGVDIDRSRVQLDYISARPDAGRRIRAFFGPLVVSERIARRPSRLICTKAKTVAVADDDRSLTLSYFTNSEYVFERVFIKEEEDRVKVGIVERAPNGFVTLVGSHRTAEATLSEPLGDREVVDARTGKTVKVLR